MFKLEDRLVAAEGVLSRFGNSVLYKVSLVYVSTSIFQSEQLLFTPRRPTTNALPLIFAFPNTYCVGITSLGYQGVWAMLCRRSDLQVSRLFTDVHEPLPRKPELLGFSFSWELDYANLLQMLADLDLPLRSSQRTAAHPLVFGGGSVLTANPEPFADFFDVILLGDGEGVLDTFITTMQGVRGANRATQLLTLAQVPGLYVPSLYEVRYQTPVGAISAIQPLHPDIPAQVSIQTYRGNTLSASTVVTPKAAWENIYMVEVVRSCPEMCRFCLASYLTLPFRTPDVNQTLIPQIEKGLTVTHRIGLLGASVTQHPEFDQLLDFFARPACDQVRLSIASVRTNTVTVKLASLLAQRDTRSITIAMESGSERVRQIVNKKLDNDQIYQAAANAYQGGLKGMKFYGMVGIPGEEEADIEATIALMQRLKGQVPGLRLTLGCSTFVPKAHTPFQWLGVNSQAKQSLKVVERRLRSQGIDFRPESYNWSVIQALLARGDRRLSHLLELTRHFGESLGSYRRAFKQLQGQIPDLTFYVFANWPTDQVLPWSHLQGALPPSTLAKHLHSAMDSGIHRDSPG
jgi:radical SAM superfamily enzyme YgiQ (UPF0313 family)